MKAALLVSAGLLFCCACEDHPSAPPTPAPSEAPPAAAAAEEAPATLAFSLADGDITNAFFRQGDVAAHVVVSSGTSPRIVFAFPAGNAGIGVWFDDVARPATLALDGEVRAARGPNGLRGVTARFRVTAPRLSFAPPVMSSIRVLRDFAGTRTLPPELSAAVKVDSPLSFSRTTLSGKDRFVLSVVAEDGTRIETGDGDRITLSAAKDGAIEISLTALHTDPPLSPIARGDILLPSVEATADPALLSALAFLTYKEKLLAGSWRFLTYFGRDTLLSVRLLMPALQPEVIEGALGAVIDRLSDGGEVAHEEDIGEFASLRHLRAGKKPAPKPIYDYKMVDDDFLLAPVLAHYLLDTGAGKSRGAKFLARKTAAKKTYRAAVESNLAFVVAAATPYAKSGAVADLIALHPGEKVGDWRDSEAGLGGGRFSYNINAALVPAALAAAARLYRSPFFGPDKARAEAAEALYAKWKDAGKHFAVSVAAKDAEGRLKTYAKEMGIPVPEAHAGAVAFPALSLDARGEPVPIMSSDDSFVLMFGDPDDAQLSAIADRIRAPFPRGLMTPVGVVVANPAYAKDAALRARFGKDAYHGAVIWSWQQAMLAAGLARQLSRDDLAPATREALKSAQAALWQVIGAAKDIRAAEHWTWRFADGAYHIARFGGGADTEANAAQLWSTVYLAVKPPAASAATPGNK